MGSLRSKDVERGLKSAPLLRLNWHRTCSISSVGQQPSKATARHLVPLDLSFDEHIHIDTYKPQVDCVRSFAFFSSLGDQMRCSETGPLAKASCSSPLCSSCGKKVHCQTRFMSNLDPDISSNDQVLGSPHRQFPGYLPMARMAPQRFLPGCTSSGHFRHVGHPVRTLPTLLDPTHHRIHCQHSAIQPMKHPSKNPSERQDPGNRCGVSCACRNLMWGKVMGTMTTYFSKFWVNS